MKAVILAAGEGKRLKPITSTRPKPMIPIAGTPLLEHTIKALKEAGIKEILLIVGYKEEMIRNYFNAKMKDLGVKIDYITQEEYLGTAHAAAYARDFVGKKKSFLLMYGDLLIDPEIFSKVIERFNDSNAQGLITLLRVETPQDYGIITLNSEGIVEKITEKPALELGLGNLANAGIYIFDSLIFDAIEKTELSIRKEYEFTDSMEILMNQFNGKIVGYTIQNQFWSDIGLPWQLLDANKYLLEKIRKNNQGSVENNVKIIGNVVVGKNTEIRSGSYIEGPCFIGENSVIGPNALIRPYSSIGNNCHIGISEVKNSLIFSDSNIPHFNYVGDSVICENVNLGAGTKIANLRLDNGSVKMNVKGREVNTNRRKLGVIIGPHVKIGINSSLMTGRKIGENSRIGAHTLVDEDVSPNKIYYHDPNKGIVKKDR